MPLKFNCEGCGSPIVVKYLKAGDVAKCPACGKDTVVPDESVQTKEDPTYIALARTQKAQRQGAAETSKAQGITCQVYDKSDYAGFWRRFSAHFLDGLVLTALFAVARLTLDEEGLLIMLLFSAIYLWGMKTFRGGTLSYLLLGMKIISIDGKDASFRQIIIRSISTIFSTMALGLGFLWMLFDKNKQTWHDKIAGTYVILEDTKPVNAFQIKRRHPIRTRLFVLLSLPFFPFVLLCVPASIMVVKLWTSEPYQMAKRYAKKSPEIRAEIGKIKTMSPGLGNIWGDSAEIEFAVVGDKIGVNYKCVLINQNNKWKIRKAFYVDRDSNIVILKGESDIH